MVKWPLSTHTCLFVVAALPPEEKGNCRQPAFRHSKEPPLKLTNFSVNKIRCDLPPNRRPNVLIVTNACLHLQ